MDNGPSYRASVEITALVQFTRLGMNIQKNKLYRPKTIYEHHDPFENFPRKLHVPKAMTAPGHHCSNVGRNHLTYSYAETKVW